MRRLVEEKGGSIFITIVSWSRGNMKGENIREKEREREGNFTEGRERKLIKKLKAFSCNSKFEERDNIALPATFIISQSHADTR